jgi:ribosome assembly protein 1
MNSDTHSVKDFASIIGKKLGVRTELLEKTLWGDFYFQPKTKKIFTSNIDGKLSPMFVTFVLNPLWEVYNTIHSYEIFSISSFSNFNNRNDKVRLQKIIDSQKLKVNPRELAKEDPKEVVRSVLPVWLPLADALLNVVARHLPNPIEAQKMKMSTLYRVIPGTKKNFFFLFLQAKIFFYLFPQTSLQICQQLNHAS